MLKINKIVYNAIYMRVIFAISDRLMSYKCLELFIKKTKIVPIMFLFSDKKEGGYIDIIKEKYKPKYLEGITAIRNPENLDIIREQKPDFIISVLYPYIFKQPIFSFPTRGILNLHPSYLPFNKGTGSYTWCIMDRTLNGVTLHWVDEGIDTGKYIMRDSIVICEEDTANDLYKKVEKCGITLFDSFLNKYNLNEDIPAYDYIEEGTYHDRKSKQTIREINLNENAEIAIKKMKALTTSNKNEAAYYTKDGIKYGVNISIFKID